MANPVQLHGHRETWAVAQVTFDPATPGANTVAEQTFTLLGVEVGDLVWVVKSTVTTDVALGQARVSAADTVAVTFIGLDIPGAPPSEVYTVFWWRPGRPSVTSVEGLAP